MFLLLSKKGDKVAHIGNAHTWELRRSEGYRFKTSLGYNREESITNRASISGGNACTRGKDKRNMENIRATWQ